MKILLLGANGQVGHELRRSLAPLGEVVATTRTGILRSAGTCAIADLGQPGTLPALIERVAPRLVVNAAAYTSVDKAEDDVESAFRVNAEAPGVLARACAAHGIPFVHYSTDYVFDGKESRPYREDDVARPLGVYGASKLAGEHAVLAAGGTSLILRTAWVYGSHGHNFLRTMLRLGAERDELRVVADQRGTPTPAFLIADVTSTLLQSGDISGGTYHLTASGETTWHGFATAIMEGARERGIIRRIPRVVPIPATEFPTRAVRPAYSRLDLVKLEAALAHSMPDWRDGLAHVLDKLAGNPAAP